MLGLGLALAALCGSGQKEQHARVAQTLDRLLSCLRDGGGQQGRMMQEVSELSFPPLTLAHERAA